MSERTCVKCGEEMTPIMFREEEYDAYGYKTGRYRMSCSHLLCEYCGNTECVDGDYLAGDWITDKG